MAQTRVTLPENDWWQGPLLTDLEHTLIQNRHHAPIRMRIEATPPAASETGGFKIPPWAFIGGSEFKFTGQAPAYRVYARGPGTIEFWDGN